MLFLQNKTIIAIFVSSFLLTNCARVSLSSPDGKSTMAGSLMNGSMSYSEGVGCQPAQPNPSVAAPVTAPPPMKMKQVCDVDGNNCALSLMATDTPPVCITRVANVKSTDFGDYAKWGLAGAATIALMVITGS